jgi:NDP-sugar pyrophosphorylase family protein
MKAIVLCAGRGTRLGDLTRHTPKPMLPIQGRPLLGYILAHLAGQGYRDIGINLHHLAGGITDHFRDGSRFGVNIHYEYETDLLGTAGALGNFSGWLQGEASFLVQYGDVLTNQDFSLLEAVHVETDALATLLLHRRDGSNSIIEIDARGRILTFVERPGPNAIPKAGHQWVNSGVQILSREVLDLLPASGIADLPADIYVPHVSDRVLVGVPLTGYRCAVDSPARYEEARNAIATGRFRIALGETV